MEQQNKQQKTYLGVKRVEAYPETRDGQPGYGVIYPDGYKSWCPKGTFEKYNFPLDLGDRITERDADRFYGVGEERQEKCGDTTCMVFGSDIAGFEYLASSASVKAENYSDSIGAELARQKILGKITAHLGFVLNWALNGLEQ